MLIGCILLLGWISMRFGTTVGAVAVLIFIALFVIGLLAASHKDNKAYYNRTTWWANGGPEQYRRKQSHR